MKIVKYGKMWRKSKTIYSVMVTHFAGAGEKLRTFSAIFFSTLQQQAIPNLQY